MRYYDLPQGRFPSVTTILDATMPPEDRLTLDRWYANNSSALLVNALSRERGDRVHAWISAYVTGQPIEIAYDYAPYLEQLRPFLDQLIASAGVLLTDHRVWDVDRRYAGTLDLCVMADRITLVDVKTKRHRILPQSLDAALLQCVAYAEALADQNIWVDELLILVVTPKRLESVRVAAPLELEQLSRRWAARLSAFYGESIDVPSASPWRKSELHS